MASMRIRRSASAIVLMGVAMVGCGSSHRITADTVCSDYLDQPGDVRHDAAVRISSEMHVQGGGDPMMGLSLDAACGARRSMTVGQYFRGEG